MGHPVAWEWLAPPPQGPSAGTSEQRWRNGFFFFFFSDSSTRAAMVNQVGGGLGVGIKSGRWERLVLGGAKWAAWACRCRLGWRRHYLQSAVFVEDNLMFLL